MRPERVFGHVLHQQAFIVEVHFRAVEPLLDELAELGEHEIHEVAARSQPEKSCQKGCFSCGSVPRWRSDISRTKRSL